MELIVLIIGLLIFGLGVILCITALFLEDFKDLIPSIITISLGIILIFNSDNLTYYEQYGDVIETHYKIEPKIKIVEYTQPYTKVKYKDTIFIYARKYPVRGN